jgi:hypothetical protein
MQELARRLHRYGSSRPALTAAIGKPSIRGAPMTDHITEIADHERSTRRWIVPFAIIVIAAIVVFIVLLVRPDL